MFPKFNLPWPRRDRTKPSRIPQRASTTPPVIRRVDNLSPSTHGAFRLNPTPTPLTIGLHSTPTYPPSVVGGTNTYEYTVPLRGPNAPEISIMYVLCSLLTLRRSTSPSTDSVMGATGSGKSTVCLFLVAVPLYCRKAHHSSPRLAQFINLVSGSSLSVSGELRSCTNTVQAAGALNLDGRRIVLIDTPGFGDTTQSDTDVLRMITAFLGAS